MSVANKRRKEEINGRIEKNGKRGIHKLKEWSNIECEGNFKEK